MNRALSALAAMLLGISLVLDASYVGGKIWTSPVPPISFSQTRLARQLVSETITVKAEDEASGTGVVIIRGDRVFVWTAGHVVAHLRRSESAFDAADIVRRIVKDGKETGQESFRARVIRWSDPDAGDDLALLEINNPHGFTSSATFYLDKNPPAIGSELYHVGSMFGPKGADSFMTGVYSAYGREMSGTYFDQTSVRAVPGCSGGGVFLADGRYVGMEVRIIDQAYSLSLIVPVRRMHDWAKKAGVEWALNPSLSVPINIEPKFDKAN